MSRRIVGALMLCLLFTHCSIAPLSNFDKTFISKYSVDSSLQTVLDDHAHEIIKKFNSMKPFNGELKHGVWVFDWLPGYFIKYNLARIYGMEKMRRCIENDNLDLLTLPNKQVYHIKGRPHTLNSRNYAIIIKKVEGRAHHTPLTLRQVQQLCTLIKHTTYVSMTKTNYIPLKHDKIALIDTESTFDRKKVLKGLVRLIQGGHNIHTDYEEDALKYICFEILGILSTKKNKRSEANYKRILNFFEKKKRLVLLTVPELHRVLHNAIS